MFYSRTQWERDFAKFFSPNYSKKKRLKLLSYRRYGENVKYCLFLLGLFLHAAVRGGTCAFTLKIVNTLINNSSRDDRLSILDIESTHGQPGSCRARPVNVDDGLGDIRWIRGLGAEKLPTACYALLPNLNDGLFCHRRGMGNLFCLFSTQQCPNLFASDAWPAPATYHRSFCEHCDQRVGRNP